MKNKLTDLNDHLFAQIERLSDDELAGEKLAIEIDRSKAIAQVASAIIDNATLILDACKAASEHGIKTPLMIEASE